MLNEGDDLVFGGSKSVLWHSVDMIFIVYAEVPWTFRLLLLVSSLFQSGTFAAVEIRSHSN